MSCNSLHFKHAERVGIPFEYAAPTMQMAALCVQLQWAGLKRKVNNGVVSSKVNSLLGETKLSSLFDVFSTVHHSIGLFLQPTLMHNSITTCMSHYYPRHVSGLDMPILRRNKCTNTASGILARSKFYDKQLFWMLHLAKVPRNHLTKF